MLSVNHRYMERAFRENMGFDGTPIRLWFRGKGAGIKPGAPEQGRSSSGSRVGGRGGSKSGGRKPRLARSR